MTYVYDDVTYVYDDVTYVYVHTNLEKEPLGILGALRL